MSFFAFPIIVLFTHLIASRPLKLYALWPHLDIPVHYMDGVSIASTPAQILAYLEKERPSITFNKTILVIWMFSITATAVVFWKFVEFIGDRLLHTNIQISLANTMQDPCMGMLGGATCILFYFTRWRKDVDG